MPDNETSAPASVKTRFAPPEVSALLLADIGHRETGGKHGLLGIFHNFVLPQIPVQAQCFLFLRLVDGRGDCPLILRIADAETGLVLADQLCTARFTNPLEPLDVLVPVTFGLTKTGALLVSVLHQHNVLKSVRVPVQMAVRPTEPGAPGAVNFTQPGAI